MQHVRRERQLLRRVVQHLHSPACDLVRSPVGSGVRRFPGGVNQAVGLEGTKGSVQASWIVAAETERVEAFEQVVAVGGPLPEQKQQTWTKEVSG